jgi:membrane dipeptidase
VGTKLRLFIQKNEQAFCFRYIETRRDCTMKIFDGHCDVLYKMWEAQQKNGTIPSFYSEKESSLRVTMPNMAAAGVAIQACAVYLPQRIRGSRRFTAALEIIDLFYEHIIKDERYIKPIRTARDLEEVEKGGKKGALLTLEGADALEGSLLNLRILYQLGVRAIGLTWNFRNEAADGVGESNPAGLSQFGKQVVTEANRLGIILDVSHLAEPGFWELAELTRQPFIASHSNCRAVCDHPRNLTDKQIKAVIKAGGVIGVTFVPYFLSAKSKTDITDVLRHIEHLLSLGAEDHLAFGSDFDGIDETMIDLTSQREYTKLREALVKEYGENRVNKWLWGNWKRILTALL